MPIKYPDFLQHNNPDAVLIDATENQTKGFGFFATTGDRDDLDVALQTTGYIAIVGSTPYIYTGGGWGSSGNWKDISPIASINDLTDTPPSFGSYKNVLTVNQNTDGLVYSDLIEEITNEVLDLVNSSSSYTQASADLDGDGLVTAQDLLLLLAQYGTAANTPFTAAWHLDDSDSSLPYTGSGNESNDTSAPSDSNTNLLFLEAPSQVSSYTPWTITTNTNNETVTIAQSNGDSAESVEYSKRIKFIDPIVITIQQTLNTINIYNFFLKTVYSYPTASDLTVWYNIGEISFANANYLANGSDAIDKTLFGTENILDFFDHENGSEHPSSATMSFRYMKTDQEGASYVKLKNVNFQWKS